MQKECSNRQYLTDDILLILVYPHQKLGSLHWLSVSISLEQFMNFFLMVISHWQVEQQSWQSFLINQRLTLKRSFFEQCFNFAITWLNTHSQLAVKLVPTFADIDHFIPRKVVRGKNDWAFERIPTLNLLALYISLVQEQGTFPIRFEIAPIAWHQYIYPTPQVNTIGCVLQTYNIDACHIHQSLR